MCAYLHLADSWSVAYRKFVPVMNAMKTKNLRRIDFSFSSETFLGR